MSNRLFRNEDARGILLETPDDTINADPAQLAKLVTNPGRIHVLAPGEPCKLKRLKK
jgi:hypothetical protein